MTNETLSYQKKYAQNDVLFLVQVQTQNGKPEKGRTETISSMFVYECDEHVIMESHCRTYSHYGQDGCEEKSTDSFHDLPVPAPSLVCFVKEIDFFITDVLH